MTYHPITDEEMIAMGFKKTDLDTWLVPHEMTVPKPNQKYSWCRDVGGSQDTGRRDQHSRSADNGIVENL
jgi:hypothetical protein